MAVVTKGWRKLVLSQEAPDHRFYTLCTLDRLQDGLHRRDTFLAKSERWADPRAKLLQGEVWRQARPNICRTLNRQTDGAAEVQALATQLDQAYHRAAEAVAASSEVRVEKRKGRDGLCVTPLDKLEEPQSLLELRQQMDALMPRVDLPEAIVEVQAWTGFADEFRHLSERRIQVEDLALSTCAVLTAEACNINLEPVVRNEIPALSYARLACVRQNHFRAETLSRAKCTPGSRTVADSAVVVDKNPILLHKTTIWLHASFGEIVRFVGTLMLKFRATVRLAFAMPIAISVTVFFQAPMIHAQSAMAAVPKWEAVSIRPCKSEPGGEHGPAPLNDSPNRIRLSCYPLPQLIRNAYVLFAGGHWTGHHPGDVKVEGIPGWGYSESFTIEAKAEGSPGQMMMHGPMLGTLLENRFALKIHSENHDEPAYALTLAKSGLKVQPFSGRCTPENPFAPDPTPGKDTCPRNPKDWPMNLDIFAWWLSGLPRVDAPVINNTGIKGYFRFNFKTFQTFNYPPFPPDQVMDSVRAALEDIGLKLVTTKAPRRRLVIDHVEKPSAN